MGLDLFLQTEKMASCNFRRGLVLFNLKKLAAISQNNAAFSTTARILGGHGPVSKYELHGGEKVHVPVGLGIGKREVVGYGNCGQENYVDHVHYPFPHSRCHRNHCDPQRLHPGLTWPSRRCYPSQGSRSRLPCCSLQKICSSRQRRCCFCRLG